MQAMSTTICLTLYVVIIHNMNTVAGATARQFLRLNAAVKSTVTIMFLFYSLSWICTFMPQESGKLRKQKKITKFKLGSCVGLHFNRKYSSFRSYPQMYSS